MSQAASERPAMLVRGARSGRLEPPVFEPANQCGPAVGRNTGIRGEPALRKACVGVDRLALGDPRVSDRLTGNDVHDLAVLAQVDRLEPR